MRTASRRLIALALAAATLSSGCIFYARGGPPRVKSDDEIHQLEKRVYRLEKRMDAVEATLSGAEDGVP